MIRLTTLDDDVTMVSVAETGDAQLVVMATPFDTLPLDAETLPLHRVVDSTGFISMSSSAVLRFVL